MKLDVLAIGVHPDDVELGCGGTVIQTVKSGKSVGILDLTKGELGTRGNAELRLQEAAGASQIMQLAIRDQLNLEDGFFELNNENKMKLIEKIRLYQPEIVLCNAPKDRHPDHGRASQLTSEACFLSGLVKIKTSLNGIDQSPWRPKRVYRFIQDWHLTPSVVFDISEVFDQKIKAIMAYKSQFFNADSKEPETPISSKQFSDFLEARARSLGRMIGTEFAEGFILDQPPGTKDLFSIL
ncbi:MAG: bacillithiol biosynthesis deacetylase BshB1 [Flavobacteriales bacterium]|nr:bacillithiol biosynthesis deacetylase BshB1 [Flavobacteriales bacterium]